MAKIGSIEETTNLFEIRIELNKVFDDIVDRVNKRREQLLSQIEEFMRDYEVLRKHSTDCFDTGDKKNYYNYTIEDIPFEELTEEAINKPRPKYKLTLEIEELEKTLISIGEIEKIPIKPALPPKRSQSYSAKNRNFHQIGGRGVEKGKFQKPRGIAISDNDVIAVADQGRQIVVVMKLTGLVVAEFKQDSPYGVCIRGEELFTSDLKRDCIFKYSLRSYQLERFSKNKGSLLAPKGLDYDVKRGLIYVADSVKHTIVQFNTWLDFVWEFGGRKILFRPEDVKLNTKTGQVLVLDHSESGFMHIFSTEGVKLETITTINKPRVMTTSFFCIDRDQNLVISDTEANTIKVFTLGGKNLKIIGQEGERAGDLMYPRGVCCREEGNCYLVASSNEHFTIQMF